MRSTLAASSTRASAAPTAEGRAAAVGDGGWDHHGRPAAEEGGEAESVLQPQRRLVAPGDLGRRGSRGQLGEHGQGLVSDVALVGKAEDLATSSADG